MLGLYYAAVHHAPKEIHLGVMLCSNGRRRWDVRKHPSAASYPIIAFNSSTTGRRRKYLFYVSVKLSMSLRPSEAWAVRAGFMEAAPTLSHVSFRVQSFAFSWILPDSQSRK